MGWASGSEVAVPLIEAIKKHVKDKKIKRLLYEVLYETLTDNDWDTVDEAMGIDPVFDEVTGIENE